MLEEIRARSNVARAVERLENELKKMIGVKDYSASQQKERECYWLLANLYHSVDI